MNAKHILPVIVLFTAFIVSTVSLIAGGSLENLSEMRSTLAVERERNSELSSYVDALRSEVEGIKHDDRALEKAARNELGMARPDEVTIIFEKPASPAAAGR